MPINLAIQDILPEKDDPYTLDEITARIMASLDSGMSYGRVYRALLHLRKADPDSVHPISKSRPLIFEFEPARRIARHALRRETKKLLKQAQKNNSANSPTIER